VDKWTNYDPNLKVSPNKELTNETADIFSFLNDNSAVEAEAEDDSDDSDDTDDTDTSGDDEEFKKIALDKEGVEDNNPPPSLVLENTPLTLKNCASEYPPPTKVIKKDKINKTVEDILAEIKSIAPNIGI
jgi:hypothetical protein